MKQILAHCAFLWVIFCIQPTHTVENKTHHVDALCNRCECLNLKEIYSADCDNKHFVKIPEFKKDLKLRWRFTIRGNSLTSIPVFPYLENLTALSFGHNKISTIEEAAFINLTSLQSLDLSHNNLTADSLNSEIFRGPPSSKLNKIPLKNLSLSHNYLKRLPSHAFKYLANLISLDISGNPLFDLSLETANSISELKNLRTLNLSHTNLKRLPHHFFADLTNLVELDLSGNDFTTVPSEVNYVRSLKTLSLNDNFFMALTEDSFWDTLKYVETLYLKRSSTLREVHNGAFGNLTSLKILWLSDNPYLGDIFPFAFTNKDNRTVDLRELHLENNDLEYLPKSALSWKDIPYLNLQGNPWNCDCNFEWFAKDVIPAMQESHFDLTRNIVCANPVELMGKGVLYDDVQKHKLVCNEYTPNAEKHNFVVVATITVGTVLLVTGAIVFSYVLFKKTKVREWVGENVKYRKTPNEEEEMITSNTD